MKKFTALFLVFSILALSGSMYAKERKGAELYIHKKDGQYERGELIVVKKNSLLLKDYYSGVDVSVDIKDVKVIKIEKESKALLGAGIGLGIGGVFGALIGTGEAAKEKEEGGMFAGMFSEELTIIGAVLIFGLGGAIIGGISGGLVGTDKTFQFEGKSDSEIQEILEKLRRKARVKNYQ